MGNDDEQVITIKVGGEVTEIIGDQFGVMRDPFGLAQVINVHTGVTVYRERVRSGVRDNPTITLKNYKHVKTTEPTDE